MLEVLVRARDRGFLGPGDPAEHLDHARGFVDLAAARAGVPERVADLGTGGGVPGLVLALEWPAATVVLIESSVKRATWLAEAVSHLELGDRVQVCEARAEDLAHDPGRREHFDLVTARSFAPPAVTAEIGAGLVAVGGALVVSEPPASADRWPERELAGLGFGPADVRAATGAHFAYLPKVRGAPEGVPRRRGRAAKQPRW